MNAELMYAILAMDAYNRGYDAGICGSSVPPMIARASTILSLAIPLAANNNKRLCTPSGPVGQLRAYF